MTTELLVLVAGSLDSRQALLCHSSCVSTGDRNCSSSQPVPT